MKKLHMRKKWLEYQYWDLEKSTCRIAREFGCSQTAVYNWLTRFHIPTRNLSESQRLVKSNHIEISGRLTEFLNGLLLGDGHLDWHKWSSAYYNASKHEVLLEWLSTQLLHFGIEQVGKVWRQEKDTFFPNGKKCHTISFFYNSRRYVELKNWQKKWYRPAFREERQKGRKFIKVVPKDVHLTPLTCLMWYIGDGSFHEDFGYISFATQCFSDSEIDFLISLLEELGFKATKHSNRSICLSTKNTKNFLKYIGPCPKKIKTIYRYKWGIYGLLKVKLKEAKEWKRTSSNLRKRLIKKLYEAESFGERKTKKIL